VTVGEEDETPVGPAADGWPVELRGVTESVVATRGPEGRWNFAPLGLHDERPVRARTWGRTRTRHNFEERGEGYVQFTRDPLDFTEAALAVREADEPVLASADAWARVGVDELARGREGDTQWVDWVLVPESTGIERETVPLLNRGNAAVIEATVAASRLGVPTYDDDALRDRLEYFADVIERCGGEREQAALVRLRELVDW
jgi:hypothetical protein